MTAPVSGSCSHRTLGKRRRYIDPNVIQEECLEQCELVSNRVQCETCWHKHDDDTPVCIRAAQGHCSRPVARPEFFTKHERDSAYGLTNVLDLSSPQQDLDKFVLNGLIAEGTRRKEDKCHRCYLSAAHPQKSKSLLDHVGNHRSLLTFITSGTSTRIMKLIWS